MVLINLSGSVLELMLEQIRAIAVRISQSIDLNEIFNITLKEVREMLQIDRLLIYRFLPNGDGVVAEESVNPKWKAIKGELIYDPCFKATWIEQYRQGHISLLEDIDAKPLDPCYKELLTRFEIRANLVIPIFIRSQKSRVKKLPKLWGLLIAHQCSSPRQWHSIEIKYLQQVAAQLEIAIQQAGLRWRLQQQNHLGKRETQQTEKLKQPEGSLQNTILEELQKKEALLRCITDFSLLGFYVVDHRTGSILYFNHRFCEIWAIEHLETQMREGRVKDHDILLNRLLLVGDLLTFIKSYKPLESEDNSITLENEMLLIDGRTIRHFSSQLRDSEDRYLGRLYIFEDISQRRELEKFFHLTNFSIDNIAISIIWTDKNGRILRVNEAACQTRGYSRAELESMYVYDLDPNFSEEKWVEHWLNLKQQKHITFISQHKRENGQLFPVEITVNYVEFNGEEYNFAFARDISHRLQAEAALRESEVRWQYALEGSGDGVWDWNAQTNEVFFSRQWKEMLGFASSEIGNTFNEWSERIHPNDKASVFHQIKQHFQGETEQYITEHRVKCKDGTYKWILARGKVFTCTKDGLALRVIGTHTDITERKLMEQALRESDERYRSVIATLAEGIVIQQADGRITTCNESAEKILGLTADQMMGRTSIDSLWKAIHEDGSPFPGETHPAMVTLRTGEPQIEVVMGVHKPDGSLTWILINSQPLFQPNQPQPYAVVTSFVDMTISKRTEQVLRQQAESERMIYTIAQNIRQSLDLDDILNTTVTEVRNFLQTDRVIIYRFNLDWSGVVVKESVAEGWSAILNMEITDTYFVEKQDQSYQQNTIKITPDIYTAGFAPCHVELLERLQVRAKLVVPILQGDRLWGLLIAHHCRAPRYWHPQESRLLNQLATQIAIAIQQSELYQQLQLANEQLQNLVMIDQLTQIANRRAFDQKLKEEWHRLLREQSPLSLLLCDIDHFKQYNDTYGHSAGDICLTLIAQALKQGAKRSTDLVARYGGEEFAVVLPNTNADGAFLVAQKIHQAVQKINIPHVASNVEQYVTLSIGIATVIPITGMTPLDLIKAADQALYQAKAQGRNRTSKRRLFLVE